MKSISLTTNSCCELNKAPVWRATSGSACFMVGGCSVREAHDAFQFAEVSAVHHWQKGPITETAQGFFGGVVGMEMGQWLRRKHAAQSGAFLKLTGLPAQFFLADS